MLAAKKILSLFEELNEKLKKEGQKAELGLLGGRVMCLVFNAREATRDVDAVFEPKDLIRKIASKIGERHGIGEDWLNDAAKGYLSKNIDKNDVLNLSNLHVWSPKADYMLAMKCISARWDTSDRDDVLFLIRHLRLRAAFDVFKIIEKYYPQKQITPKTQFLIEGVFENS